MIIAAPIFRAILFFYFEAGPTALGRHFEAVSDALAFGCVLAATYEFLGRQPRYVAFAKSPCLVFAAVALLVLPSAMLRSPPPGDSSGWPDRSPILGAVLLIDRSVRFPGEPQRTVS